MLRPLTRPILEPENYRGPSGLSRKKESSDITKIHLPPFFDLLPMAVRAHKVEVKRGAEAYAKLGQGPDYSEGQHPISVLFHSTSDCLNQWCIASKKA